MLRAKSDCLLVIFLVLLIAGCRQDMHNQPKYKPLRTSNFFADAQGSRQPVENTVARGSLNNDALSPSQTNSAQTSIAPAGAAVTNPANQTTTNPRPAGADNIPFAITEQVLARGEERYNISCSPCHGRTGNADGMVVRRGFPQPPSYHIDRLRSVPDAYFYTVITNGFGRMWSYADQVSPRDRWAITAYIRALQLSQNATLADVPADKQSQLQSGGQPR